MQAPTTSLFNRPVVYNIGYQGRKLDNFIHTLTTNQVDVLVDLREKPFSRQRGFSKGPLSSALEAASIRYEWYGRRLGGLTVSRQEWAKALPKIAAMAATSTVCLMCMEKNPNTCHRREVSRMLEDEHNIVGVPI